MATYPVAMPVQAFGVMAGGDPETNRRHLQDAISSVAAATVRDEYASAPTLIFPVADDPYVFDGDIIIDRNILIEGAGAVGRTINGVNLRFTRNAKAGFFLRAPGGASSPAEYRDSVGPNAYSAGRSQLRNLDIGPVESGTVNFGIVHNVPATFEHVSVHGFKLAGFFAHGQTSGNAEYGEPNGTGGRGTMWGNTNGSLYLKCISQQQTGGHGFAAQGNNAQIMTYLSCDASSNKGCGFWDNSSIGNHYICCHTADNSFRVRRHGSFYMPIKRHIASAANEPGQGSDWRMFWVLVEATTADDSEWAVGKIYGEAGGINIVPEHGTYPTILSHYTEGSTEFGVVPRGNATVIGGVAGGGRVYRGADTKNVRCAATALSDTPAKWRGGSEDGSEEWGSALGTNPSQPIFFDAGHSDDPEAYRGVRGIRLGYSVTRHAYELLKGAAERVLSITAEHWKLGPYSGAGQVYFANGLIVGGPGASRMRAAASISAIPGGLRVEKGEIFILTNAEPEGHAFAFVTRGGTIGVDAVVKGVGKIDV